MSCVLCGTYKDIRTNQSKFERLVLTAYYIGNRGDRLELCEDHADLLAAVVVATETVAEEKSR